MLISSKNLKPGMVLSSNVYQKGNNIIPLLTSGTVLDEAKIKSIIDKNILSISIDSINETVPTSLQTDTILAMKKLDLNKTHANAKEIIYNILKNQEFVFGYDKYSVFEDKEYLHAVNVAAFSIKLAKHYNENVKNSEYLDYEIIALTALLHNIGKIFEDPIKFKKLIPFHLDKNNYPYFDENCFERYNPNMHGVYTYSLLNNTFGISIPGHVKSAILILNEKDNGEGLLGRKKDSLKNQKIDNIAKIVHLCDIFDELLYECRKNNLPPNNIIELLDYYVANNEIDTNLTELLKNSIPLYSIGLDVVLSNGLKAQVYQNNDGKPTMPVVSLPIEDNNIIVKDVLTKHKNTNSILKAKLDLEKAICTNNFINIKSGINNLIEQIKLNGYCIDYDEYKTLKSETEHLINICCIAIYVTYNNQSDNNTYTNQDYINLCFNVLNQKLNSVENIVQDMHKKRTDISAIDEIIAFSKIYDIIVNNCVRNKLPLFKIRKYIDVFAEKNNFSKDIIDIFNSKLPLLYDDDIILLEDNIPAKVLKYDFKEIDKSKIIVDLLNLNNLTIQNIDNYNSIYEPAYDVLNESISNEKKYY